MPNESFICKKGMKKKLLKTYNVTFEDTDFTQY